MVIRYDQIQKKDSKIPNFKINIGEHFQKNKLLVKERPICLTQNPLATSNQVNQVF